MTAHDVAFVILASLPLTLKAVETIFRRGR